MQNKILVTGGVGFIGSHTVVELVQAGYTPVIIDTLENSEPIVLDGLEKITGVKPEFYKADVNDKAALEKVFSAHPDITGVIHFAAYKAVGESMREPLKYYYNNLNNLVVLLQAMTKHGVKHIVFSSSCTVYGDPKENPLTEESLVMPALSPYGNTKQVGEEILRDAAKVSDLQIMMLRYFNPIGAHDSALIGELPVGVPNNLVPFITQAVAGWRGPLTVFGNDYPTPDGSCVRDYIHVVDVAKAHVLAMGRLLEKKNTEQVEVFNLGIGKGSSVLEVIQTFEKVTGQKVPHTIGARREGDVATMWADASKANRILGWKAERDLANALLTAWKWQESLGKKPV